MNLRLSVTILQQQLFSKFVQLFLLLFKFARLFFKLSYKCAKFLGSFEPGIRIFFTLNEMNIIRKYIDSFLNLIMSILKLLNSCDQVITFILKLLDNILVQIFVAAVFREVWVKIELVR